MLKILYAASDNYNAVIQLSRFIEAVNNKPYKLKIAAYKKSSPINTNIDWTLDCLYHIFDKDKVLLNNDNLNLYYEQVKYFNPDLIISDMEHNTSQIGNALNIPVWQCSSSLINFAINTSHKYNLGLHKKYNYTINKSRLIYENKLNIIDNSKYNFVYSHFGDINYSLIKENFDWIRPYHTIGKNSIMCKHNICAATYNKNIKMLQLLNKQSDIVLFNNNIKEEYDNFIIKNIINNSEYFCNLKNSTHFICEGQLSFLADAYYNGKKPFIILNYEDSESITNSLISFKFNLAYDASLNDFNESLSEINPIKNNKIKFLHEKIEDHFF